MKKESADNHDNVNEAILEKLKAAGHRVTKSRLQVLSVLENTKKALSPAEIFQITQKGGETELDRVTVYRILEAFEELDVILAVEDIRMLRVNIDARVELAGCFLCDQYFRLLDMMLSE